MSEAADKLVHAAMRLFATQGYERTSVPQIQAAAGLSSRSGALYKHFASKEALLAAVVDRFIAEAAEAQRALASLSLPAEEGLEWIGRTTLQMLAGRRDQLRILWRDLERFPHLQQRVREQVMQATYLGVAAWLERHKASGRLQVEDSAATAAVLVGGLTMFRAFEALWGERAIDVEDAAFLEAWIRFAEAGLGLRRV